MRNTKDSSFVLHSGADNLTINDRIDEEDYTGPLMIPDKDLNTEDDHHQPFD